MIETKTDDGSTIQSYSFLVKFYGCTKSDCVKAHEITARVTMSFNKDTGSVICEDIHEINRKSTMSYQDMLFCAQVCSNYSDEWKAATQEMKKVYSLSNEATKRAFFEYLDSVQPRVFTTDDVLEVVKSSPRILHDLSKTRTEETLFDKE